MDDPGTRPTLTVDEARADLEAPTRCPYCGAVDPLDARGRPQSGHANPARPSGLTHRAVRAYLAGAGHCPWCKGTDIEGQGHDYDGAAVWQTVICQDPACGKRWKEVYVLGRIEDPETGRVLP